MEARINGIKLSFKEKLKIITNANLIKKYKEMYTIPTAEACIHFINNFCYTYDPRLNGDKAIPFHLFSRQEEFIAWMWDCLRNKKNGIVDKARDVGITWCFCAVAVWILLFQKDYSIGLYTFKERECDKKGDVSTLFGKIRFMLNKIPFVFKSQLTDTYMYIRNEENGTDIAGASGDNPGRSGRRSIFVKDEAAFYQRPESIEASLSETSDCLIDVSTHSGIDTLFYRKIEAGETDVFIFNWWDNPNHSKEWYDKKKKKAIAEGMLHIFKREIERDPYSSIESILIPVSWLNMVVENTQIEDGKIIGSLDVADEGRDTNCLIIRQGNNLIYLDEWGEGDTGLTATKALWKCVEYGVNEFRYDAVGVGAGIKATVRMIKEANLDNKELQAIKIKGWNAGGAVIRPEEQDYNDIENKKMFENAKAQAYYRLREYVYNTYRMMINEDHDTSKLISFNGLKKHPKIMKLIGELSQVQHKTSSSGKLMIDKKPKGTKSPNLGESCVINFAEVEVEWIKWEVV